MEMGVKNILNTAQRTSPHNRLQSSYSVNNSIHDLQSYDFDSGIGLEESMAICPGQYCLHEQNLSGSVDILANKDIFVNTFLMDMIDLSLSNPPGYQGFEDATSSLAVAGLRKKRKRYK